MKMRCARLLLLAALMTSVAAADDTAEVVDSPAKAEVEPPEVVERSGYTDRMQLETTSVRGNQELPRLLYIVPWKDPSLGDVTGKPVNSLIEEVLAPLDRDVFLRQTSYFDQLYGVPETGVPD